MAVNHRGIEKNEPRLLLFVLGIVWLVVPYFLLCRTTYPIPNGIDEAETIFNQAWRLSSLTGNVIARVMTITSSISTLMNDIRMLVFSMMFLQGPGRTKQEYPASNFVCVYLYGHENKEYLEQGSVTRVLLFSFRSLPRSIP
ncbi:hypothetical protein FRC03_007742 [Tulasnella sp. 419]|nr:hypothetical protein FRC03_007742 [Tulasnella sp. 419]